MQSDRSSSYGLLSSLRVFWARAGTKSMYSTYESPPFPIKIDTPTWKDICSEMRFSDYFMFGTIYTVGTLWAYAAARKLPFVMQRLIVYHSCSHMSLVLGISLLISVPYRRLTGFHDNGLRWKKPENKLNKFDHTSHFEANTIWHRARIDNTK